MDSATESSPTPPSSSPSPSPSSPPRGRVSYALLVAGLCLGLAPLFPLILCTFTAPQYPDKSPSVSVYAGAVTGDTQEFTTLTRYIGINFPPDVPELRTPLVATALVLIGLLAGVAAFLPRRGRIAMVIAVLALTVCMGGWGQFRFYQAGHNLDPTAPMRTIMKPFTPPLFGWISIRRIRIYHMPHLGSFLILAGAGLALCGGVRSYRRRPELPPGV